MIITNKSANETTTFECLEKEDMFWYNNGLFMKVSDNDSDKNNAYSFTENELTHINQNIFVNYIPSELILHERGWTPCE